MNCRDIPPTVWEHTREGLRFYFSRRIKADDAEELAQETISRVWARPDFEFERTEDFTRVCFAFAHRVCLEFHRESAKRAGIELDPDTTAPDHHWGGSRSSEAAILLREVLEIGRSLLRADEWQLIQTASGLETSNEHELSGKHDRVILHRARKKLARLIGRIR